MTHPTSPPGPDEGEVSVFGRGVGECVVVHLGDGRWMVVDSCLGEREPAALEYLGSLGVQPTAIELLVVSHWHDDHIRGVSKIFEAATNATWVASAALKAQEFRRLILAGRTPHAEARTTEFDRLFDAARQRQPLRRPESVGPHWALQGQRLFDTRRSRVEVAAPSPATLTLAQHEIGRLLPQIGEKRVVVAQGPNALSVVLSVTLGSFTTLLGGDLETTKDPSTGWDGVLAALVPFPRAYVLKTPHHGSAGAHHEGMWRTLLEPKPIAVTSTFNPSGLPLAADRARLRALASASYLTGHPGGARSRKVPDRALQEVLPRRLRRVHSPLGQVRIRTSLTSDSEPPRLEFFGPAFLDSAA